MMLPINEKKIDINIILKHTQGNFHSFFLLSEKKNVIFKSLVVFEQCRFENVETAFLKRN